MLSMVPKILIVDDNRINCLVYRRMFAKLNVILDFAHDGETGLNKFEQNNYELVLLDIDLPKINGLCVTHSIRKNESAEISKQRIPVIAVTAYDSSENCNLAYKAGVDEYVTMPFIRIDLMKLIAKYLKEFRVWP